MGMLSDKKILKQDELFDVKFDDGFVAAAGLSVTNGIERAANMTALYAHQGMQLLKRMDTYAYGSVQDEITRQRVEQEKEDIKVLNNNIKKRKNQQQLLESRISEIADIHNLGAGREFALDLISGFIEGINPVEVPIDMLGGMVASKATKALRIGNKALGLLAEKGMDGAIGGTYNAFQMNYVYDDIDNATMAKAVGIGAAQAIVLGTAGKMFASRKKIKTRAEFQEFEKAIKGYDADPKTIIKAKQFADSIDRIKRSTSNKDKMLKDLDKVIDTTFLTGSSITPEEVMKFIKLPEHSDEFINASKILNMENNKNIIENIQDNLSIRNDIAEELQTTLKAIDPAKVDQLEKAKADLEAVMKLGGKKNKNKIKKLKKTISTLEGQTYKNKINELFSQKEQIDKETFNLKTTINDQLEGYDLDTYALEKQKYQDDYMTLDVDGISKKMQEDGIVNKDYPKEKIDKEFEEIKTTRAREAVDSGKIEGLEDDDLLADAEFNKQELEEYPEVFREWESNIDEKSTLLRSWIEKGCKL